MQAIKKILDYPYHPDVKALFVLFLPIMFWQFPLLVPRNFWFWGDMAFYFYPMTALGMQQWHAGIAPVWTHLLQCGFPLLADGQGALVYPLNLLMYFIFPPPVAHNVSIVVQTFLTAGLMYAFVRTLGIGRLPGIIAGWIWVFAGPIATSIGSPALNGLVWWPLLFLLAERLSGSFSWNLIASSALVMGMGWLGGFPQTTLYGISGATCYMLFRTIMVRENVAWRLAGWAIAGIAGCGIGAIQILPTLEMSSFSIRSGGTDYAFATQGSMLPTGLAGFLLPCWTKLSDYWLAGPNLFAGFICLAAALLTIKKRPGARTVFFWGLALIGCLISFGKFNPMYHYVYNWPGFHFLRVPARFLYLTMFCFSILSAAGFQILFDNALEGLREKRKMMNLLATLSGLSFLGLAGGSLLLHMGKGLFLKAAQAHVNRSMMGGAYKMQNAGYYQDRINRMFADITSALNPLSMECIVSFVLALAALAVIGVWMKRPKTGRFSGAVLCFLTGLNFLFLWHGPLKVHTVKDLEPPALARFCAGQVGLFRLYTVNSQADVAGIGRLDRLDADCNALFNVASTGVYSALGSKRYWELLGPLGNVNLAFGMPPVSPRVVEKGMPVLNLLNARFVQSSVTLEIPGLTQERSGPPFLYRNEKALDRAFVAASARVIPDVSAMPDSMRSAFFDPAETVLLENRPDETIENGKRSSARISLYSDRLIRLDASGPGWLVVSNLYYPGWRAWVDKRESKIHRGDYAFQALPLSAGEHSVELRFESRSFLRGLVISVLSLAAALLLLALRKKSAA